MRSLEFGVFAARPLISVVMRRDLIEAACLDKLMANERVKEI